MSKHSIEYLITQTDKVINEEEFDTQMELYADNAELVIEPGRNAVVKEQIRAAFKTIAEYFEHSLDIKTVTRLTFNYDYSPNSYN